MRVLIATDGSSFSNAAIEESCRFIRPEETEICVVSSYEDAYPIAAEPFAISAEYYQKVEDAVVEQTNANIERAVRMIRDRFAGRQVHVSTELLRGSPERQIIEKAKDWDADLIVVGSHGRGFWGRLLGSVSNGIVHHAPCSVLVVRTEAAPAPILT